MTASVEETLVAWAAHDLRSPLARIVAMAEALEDGVVAEPEEVARYLRTMRGEAGRVAAMFDDLLLLCRLRGGAVRLSRVPAPLDELVAEAVAGAAALAAPKGVAVRHRVGKRRPVAAVSAPEISRVLQNLLDKRRAPHGGGRRGVGGDERRARRVMGGRVGAGRMRRHGTRRPRPCLRWRTPAVNDGPSGARPPDRPRPHGGARRRAQCSQSGRRLRFIVRLPLAPNERNREGMDRG